MPPTRTRLQPLLLDVRETDERSGELGHIEGSVSVPLRFVSEHAHAAVSKAEAEGRPIVTICRSGRRSAAAAATLIGMGYKGVINMAGGMMAWRESEAAK